MNRVSIPGKDKYFASFSKVFKQSLGPPFSCTLVPGAVSRERFVQSETNLSLKYSIEVKNAWCNTSTLTYSLIK
jgi:hypothetical protein